MTCSSTPICTSSIVKQVLRLRIAWPLVEPFVSFPCVAGVVVSFYLLRVRWDHVTLTVRSRVRHPFPPFLRDPLLPT